MIDEAQARRLCRVRALDETDALSPAARAAADAVLRRKLESGVPVERALVARAETAIDSDPDRPLSRLLPWLVVCGAFLFGALGERLTHGRELRLLAIPLLGVWLWNLLCYLAWILGGFRGADGLASRLGGVSASFLPDRSPAAARARYAELWWESLGPLTLARWQATLHLSAIALVLGMLSGMYVGGLTLAYRAVWESTWLSADQVQALLDTLLAPAAALSGIAVPDVSGDGAAPPWVHLYALNSLLVVGLPRALLAALARLRAVRLGRRLSPDLDAPYYRRLLRARRGDTRHVVVLPYGFRPTPGTIESLGAILHDTLGARAAIELRDPLAYGDDAAPAPIDNPEQAIVVALFNLAQTPESEVHGEWLQSLVALGSRVVAAIDPSAYAAGVEPERHERRERGWRSVIEAAGAVAWPLPHPPYAAAEREARDRALEQAAALIGADA